MKKLLLSIALIMSASFAFCQTKTDSPKTSVSNVSNTAFRVKFDDLFISNPNGSVTPKYRTQVGGVTMGPGGVAFQSGVSMGGLDIAANKGHDMLIDTVKGIVIIRGIFKQ